MMRGILSNIVKIPGSNREDDSFRMVGLVLLSAA